MKSFFGIMLAIVSIGLAQGDLPSFLCDGKPVDYFVRDVSDCAGWIKCTANGLVSGVCESSMYFNEATQTCSQPENVNCFKCPTTGITNEAVESSCSRYVRCESGVPTEFVCDKGFQFNNDTKTCDLKCNVGCDERCLTNLKPGQFTARYDSKNCSIGFVCFGELEPAQINCNEKLYFDTNSLMCVRPEKSDCIVSDDIDGCEDDEEGEESCPLNLEPGEFTAKHDSANCSIGFVCFGEPDATEIHCRPTLHFDTNSLMCVRPEKSDCVLKQTTEITAVTTDIPTTTTSRSTIRTAGTPSTTVSTVVTEADTASTSDTDTTTDIDDTTTVTSEDTETSTDTTSTSDADTTTDIDDTTAVTSADTETSTETDFKPGEGETC